MEGEFLLTTILGCFVLLLSFTTAVLALDRVSIGRRHQALRHQYCEAKHRLRAYEARLDK